jgi:hypothetical protein
LTALRAPFRLCLRLEEPEPDQPAPEPAVGEMQPQGSEPHEPSPQARDPEPTPGRRARRSALSPPWYLRLLLQATQDPSLLMPARDVWRGRGRMAPVLARDEAERPVGCADRMTTPGLHACFSCRGQGPYRRPAGVRGVFQVPSGVAVGADHFWAAKIARYGLRVDWDLGPAATFSTEKARRELRSLAVRPGLKATAAGEPGAAQLRAARQVVEATYEGRSAVPAALAHGAAQLHRAPGQGLVRDLDRHAVPDHRPGAGGCGTGLLRPWLGPMAME